MQPLHPVPRQISNPFEELLGEFHDHRGNALSDLSQSSPLLVAFLRHNGCTFCRETLADLAGLRSRVEAHGVRIVLVGMSSTDELGELATEFGLGDVSRVSDPEKRLYAAFGLRRGKVMELLGPRVLLRGIAALAQGTGIGRIRGDSLQMPGVFLLQRGTVVASFVHGSIADRPDYLGLVESCRMSPATPGVGGGTA